MVREVDFLGCRLRAGPNGVELMMMQQNKIDAVRGWPVPETQTELRSFLGVANFSRSFIANFATIARPLTDLRASKNGSKSAKLAWTSVEQHSFDALKQALTNAPALAVPDEDRKFTLYTDASDFGAGAVLCQFSEEQQAMQPVGYMSGKLTGAMLNWTVYDKEFWALVSALNHWQLHLLQARHRIDVFTDHRALKYLLTQSVLNGRQSRWIDFISRFKLNICYLPGEKNAQADALSRRPDHDGGSAERQQIRRALADEQLHELMLGGLHAIMMDECYIRSTKLMDGIVAAYR